MALLFPAHPPGSWVHHAGQATPAVYGRRCRRCYAPSPPFLGSEAQLALGGPPEAAFQAGPPSTDDEQRPTSAVRVRCGAVLRQRASGAVPDRLGSRPK